MDPRPCQSRPRPTGSSGSVTRRHGPRGSRRPAMCRWVFLDGEVFRFDVDTAATRRRGGAHHGPLSAPMPATVIRIVAQPGATVKRGDTLMILEAMKMELPIRANADGTVTGVHCREGELVQPGTTLIEIDDAES